MNRQHATRFRWLIVVIAAVPLFLHQAQISCAADQEAVNLLEKIDPARDTIQGEWKRDGQTLGSSNGRSIVTIPYLPPEEYTLSAVIERRSGTRYLGLGLVFAFTACALPHRRKRRERHRLY